MYIDSFLKSFVENLNEYYSFNVGIIILAMFLIFNAITDIKKYKIYNISIILLMVSRLLLILDSSTPVFNINNIYGLVFGWCIFFIPALVLYFRMGGDIKLSAAIGFFLGVYIMPIFIAFSLITGIVYGVIKRKVNGEKVSKVSYISVTTKIMTGDLINNEEMVNKDSDKIPFALFFLIAHILMMILAYFI